MRIATYDNLGFLPSLERLGFTHPNILKFYNEHFDKDSIPTESNIHI